MCGFEVLLEAESRIQMLHGAPLDTTGTVGLLGAMLTVLFGFPWGRGGGNQALENIKQEEAKELPLSPENLGKC